MGQDWKGGDVLKYPGGGHKINLLRPVVEQWKDQNNTVLIFVDRYIGHYYLCRLNCNVNFPVVYTGNIRVQYCYSM